jgi:hypothetical protein
MATGEGWPWAPLSIIRTCNAQPFYTLRAPASETALLPFQSWQSSAPLDTPRRTPGEVNNELEWVKTRSKNNLP